ncbi:Acid sphingomyelinase-like phosphodiesterase 3a [Phytophthora boehmeriae]|uniref:Acid sphingomyelinase-like phosphodiesterase 3a n=1 Tax=Phytophthora boehmeriae TaxID=109152 RepID=A0A8T1VYC6_9STRA|nr:Acid sphingomyelinase-like phosphodiesterase 3a [Phytophthora boehmeriae]
MQVRWTTTLLAAGLAWAVSAAPGRILHFSDVHLNISETLSAEDSARIPIRYFSDAPLPLLESALSYAKQHVTSDPEVFLYTGDHAAHGLFTDEYIAKAVEMNVHTMETYYPPETQEGETLETTAIIGNADGNPDYHMEVTDPATETNPTIKSISQVWEDSLSDVKMDLLNRRGYLRYALDDKLHVITLNTVPYSPSHLPSTSEHPDPFGQFAWLEETLAKLQEAGKFAYIAGHIAPIVDSYGGNPQWHPKYIVKYKNIVGKYADVIKAQFFGHVHSVEFRVPVETLDGGAGADDAFQLLPMYISGSISPLFGNNPSFMVWDFDTKTYEVLDYAVYGSDIADSVPQLKWKLLFRASEAYGLTSLSLKDLSDFVQRAQQNVSLLEDYFWNMKAKSPNAQPCSDAQCHAKTLCTLKWWTTKGEFLACLDTAQIMLANREVDPAQAAFPEHEVGAISSSSGPSLATRSVLMTIGSTALATAAAVAGVAVVMPLLKRNGVLKNRVQYQNVLSTL